MKKVKLAVVATALAVAGFANATVMTVSMSGVISLGHDNLGLFSGKGILGGLPYVLTVSADLDAPVKYTRSPGNYTTEMSSGPFAVSATVDGVTYTFGVTDGVTMNESVISPYSLSLWGGGIDALGRQVRVQETVSQAVHTDSLIDFLYLPSPQNPIVQFSVGSGTASTQFNAFNATALIMNGDPVTLPAPVPPPGPVPVPEPATATLFGAGLLGVVVLRRRKRRQ
ncbi:PEP-CTERM sorting domain-containing protein [Massilia rhizosphaerae]|uniref:PEP-CTERM sorting domain-containing protein n=1 Tax=Massilia rhizosphaerae TaxID=2784389 RepID=UPI0018DB25CD